MSRRFRPGQTDGSLRLPGSGLHPDTGLRRPDALA